MRPTCKPWVSVLPRWLTCFVRSVLENVSAVKVSIQKDSAIESCKDWQFSELMTKEIRVQLWSINCKNEDTWLQINVNHLLRLFQGHGGTGAYLNLQMMRGSTHHATRVDMNFQFLLLHIISYIFRIVLCAEIMSTHIQRCHIYNTEK